jgi:multidrug efflux pump subunit AcrA (membrane-fusion protein)
MSTLNLQAPISGIVQRLHTSPSQVLNASAPIVDIVSLNPVWVRVPIYAGDEARINMRAPAVIRALSDFAGSSNAVMARPILSGPQTSDPLATSIDLYYEVNNASGDFRPGQKLSVTIPYEGTQTSLVVPYSAILYDIHGGTWVYENTAPHVYVRKRVGLQTVADGKAILQKGPAIGTKVVTAGAAELFGTEFGGGK